MLQTDRRPEQAERNSGRKLILAGTALRLFRPTHDILETTNYYVGLDSVRRVTISIQMCPDPVDCPLQTIFERDVGLPIQ
jgi:hypothetical protein